MCCCPLVTGNIPRHKGAHGPNTAPPHKNKQRPHASYLGPHKTFAPSRISQKQPTDNVQHDGAVDEHAQREERLNPCGRERNSRIICRVFTSLFLHNYGLMTGNKRGLRCSPSVCVKKWTASSLISVPSLKKPPSQQPFVFTVPYTVTAFLFRLLSAHPRGLCLRSP